MVLKGLQYAWKQDPLLALAVKWCITSGWKALRCRRELNRARAGTIAQLRRGTIVRHFEVERELGLPFHNMWDGAMTNRVGGKCPERYKAAIIAVLQGESQN